MEIVRTAAEFMALSAVTAPKARGRDDIATRIIADPSEMEALVEAMIEDSSEPLKANFSRDAKNIRDSVCVLFIYLKDIPTPGLNCGACGYATCDTLALQRSSMKEGPFCAWQIVDLGIAAGSAVKTASIHNVDNRIMYSAAQTACRIGLIPSRMAVAIPLQAGSKSAYFDRQS
jgi:uncharacterized ferredoxin-like protein